MSIRASSDNSKMTIELLDVLFRRIYAWARRRNPQQWHRRRIRLFVAVDFLSPARRRRRRREKVDGDFLSTSTPVWTRLKRNCCCLRSPLKRMGTGTIFRSGEQKFGEKQSRQSNSNIVYAICIFRKRYTGCGKKSNPLSYFSNF